MSCNKLPINGNAMDRVDYQTEPSRYKHWKLKFDGTIATLLADFDENGDVPLRPASTVEAYWRSRRFPLADYRFTA